MNKTDKHEVKDTRILNIINVLVFIALSSLLIWVVFTITHPKSEYKLPTDFPKGAQLPKGLKDVEYEYNGSSWTLISYETGKPKDVMSDMKQKLIERGFQLQQYISLPHGDQCMFIKGNFKYTLEVLKTDKADKVKIKYAVETI